MSAIGDERVSGPVVGVRRSNPIAIVAAWGPVVGWVAGIFSLSSDQFSDVNTAAWLSAVPWVRALGITPAVIEAANFIVRKSAHFVEYAVLGMLTLRALRASWRQRGPQVIAAAVAVAALSAILDELRQHFCTMSRTGTAKDVGLDVAGALTGAIIGATYLSRYIARGRA